MNEPSSILVAENLSKQFGSQVAVDSLDLELKAGEPIALIGPNGAGKTTFLSLLCGYLLPSGGSVSVMGQKPGSAALHGQLSALPQDAQLDPRFSVERQLNFLARLQGLNARAAKAETDRVLDQVQLSDARKKKPAELSHGMSKRISIAQMLIGKPKLALLDEPTAGLDPPNARMVRELVAQNSAATTFIISSHNLDELEKICSSVIYLTDGQLVEYLPIDHHDTDGGYLTIRMAVVEEAALLAAVGKLEGVLNVTRKQQGDFVVSYDEQRHPDLDLALLALFKQHSWQYKHLIKGRTLEDKMFQ